MEHKIKALAEAVNGEKLNKLILSHVKELAFDEEAKHLIIYVDNTAPLHEMEEEKMDEQLKKALEKIYDTNSTYELRLHKGDHPHEREKAVPHNIR